MTVTTPAPADGAEATDDNRDPGWIRVGAAIREDRKRRGMEPVHLVARVVERGGTISERSLRAIEEGRVGYKRGVSEDMARRVINALGWNPSLLAVIREEGAALPPLPDLRTPRQVTNPAATLTGRVEVARSAALAHIMDRFDQAVEEARTALVRETVGMPSLDGDSVAHQATAARAVRQMLTTRYHKVIAACEDDDYTVGLTPPGGA